MHLFRLFYLTEIKTLSKQPGIEQTIHRQTNKQTNFTAVFVIAAACGRLASSTSHIVPSTPRTRTRVFTQAISQEFRKSLTRDLLY